ncbi:hypothetical protein BDV35DRAFT_372375 [Aspergillus flavus]|uniref:Uncharacterized protein n=1 Tax=Aspergillus flavus TaxID=5059 RepID=A0A5N6GFH7_ASPFL|nr:hypothetical protein BDV35DRAFT_372375 [Aspergillus flavus]
MAAFRFVVACFSHFSPFPTHPSSRFLVYIIFLTCCISERCFLDIPCLERLTHHWVFVLWFTVAWPHLALFDRRLSTACSLEPIQ